MSIVPARSRSDRQAKSKSAAPKQTSSAPDLLEKQQSTSSDSDTEADPTFSVGEERTTKPKSRKPTSERPKRVRKRKPAVEQEKHRLGAGELFDPSTRQPRPLFEPKQPREGGPRRGLAAALAANASDIQVDAYPAIDVLVDPNIQREIGPQMGHVSTFDFDWFTSELKWLCENKNNTAFTLGVPQRALLRAHKVAQFLQEAEPGIVEALRSDTRCRLHVYFPEPVPGSDLWGFGGARVPNEYEEAAFNMIRMLAAGEERLEMSTDTLKSKLRKYLTDGNKSRISAIDLLHHFAVNIKGFAPLFSSAYMAGRTSGVIENKNAFYASLLLDLVNLFCYRQQRTPLRLRAVDICETARPKLWELAQRAFTPSISMFDVVSVALDAQAETPVEPGELRAWPPPEMNPDASNPAADRPVRHTRLYLQYREPDGRYLAEHWLQHQLGSPQYWNITAVEFALPAPTIGHLERLNGKELKNQTGAMVRSFMGRRTPVWAIGLPLCRAVPADPENDTMTNEERRQALHDYFEAIKGAFEYAYPNRQQPLYARPFDAPVIHDIHRELGISTRDVFRTPSLVLQQAENRVESQLPPNLLQKFDLQQCLVIAFTTGYEPLANQQDPAINPSLDSDFGLFPLEILFGNCNGVPIEYHQCDATGIYYVQLQQQPRARPISVDQMAGRLLSLRGCNNIIVGWHIQTLLCALHLSLPEAVVIDLAFNPVVRHFVHHAAIARGIPAALVDRMFPTDLVYGLDIRIVAALLSRDEHIIDLQPGGERDIAHEFLFIAALLRHVWTPLQEAQRFRASVPAAHLVRCGHGFTPHVTGEPG